MSWQPNTVSFAAHVRLPRLRRGNSAAHRIRPRNQTPVIRFGSVECKPSYCRHLLSYVQYPSAIMYTCTRRASPNLPAFASTRTHKRLR